LYYVYKDDIAADVFKEIPMDKKHIDKLYGAFLDIDKDGSGRLLCVYILKLS
jgi:hypothetical protein